MSLWSYQSILPFASKVLVEEITYQICSVDPYIGDGYFEDSALVIKVQEIIVLSIEVRPNRVFQ